MSQVNTQLRLRVVSLIAATAVVAAVLLPILDLAARVMA
jgi:hypothetical protein